MKTTYTIIIFLWMSLCVFLAHAQKYEQTKTITRSFPVTKESVLKLTNKYGDILVNNWDKDSVAINVTIRVTNKKEADAIEKINSIEAQFKATQFYLDAQTVFKDNKTAITADISEITSNIFNSERNVLINYSVSLPAWLNLEIYNKYGNVYVPNHTGRFTLSLSYGDFKGNDLLGENDITVNFGNVTMGTFEKGKLKTGYSDVTMKKGGSLRLESRYSKFWLTTVNTMEIDSRHDKFSVDTLSSLTGRCDFSTLQAAYLKNGLTLNSSYGDLKASLVSNTLSSIVLNSQYTDIIIGLPSQASFAITADYKKTDMVLPLNFSGIQPQLIDEKAQQYKMAGVIGKTGEQPGQITINASYGSITFLLK